MLSSNACLIIADRARRGARAVGRHDGFEAVAGGNRDHLAGLRREQFANAPRVAAAHGDTGQDQRAGVDLVGIDFGVLILPGDESAECVGVDRFLGRVGRQ